MHAWHLRRAPSCRHPNCRCELMLTSVAECPERTRREMAALQQMVALFPTSPWAALQRLDADTSKHNLSTSLASALTVAPLLFSALISRGGNRPEAGRQPEPGGEPEAAGQPEAGGGAPGEPAPPAGGERPGDGDSASAYERALALEEAG